MSSGHVVHTDKAFLIVSIWYGVFSMDVYYEFDMMICGCEISSRILLHGGYFLFPSTVCIRQCPLSFCCTLYCVFRQWHL